MPEQGTWEDFAGKEAVLQALCTAAADALSAIRKAKETALLPGGPAAYKEALLSDEQQLEELASCTSVERFRELLEQISWARLPSRRSKAMADAEEELCQQVMDLRNNVKDAVKGLGKQYFQISDEEQFFQLRATAENVRVYVKLTLAFMERLEEKKRKKNILDFADQEHLALRILTREEDGNLVPSETADVFADYFEEIMVDEYQDSNLVQEAVLESISKSRLGRDNRFMVGDVKQSIYRFRQAEPGLFLEKYARFGREEGGIRVDLHQYFRSRRTVLDSVNEAFFRIMRPELGGIDYDEEAALKAGASYPEEDRMEAELLLLKKEEWEQLQRECRWTKAEAEAHLIAGKIRQLLKEGQVTEDGELRPVRPGDVAILLRTMSGWSETFVRVLQEEGIPASAQSREGYFQTMEVETLLAYLRVLDNPTQEIPLAASLHGLLGGFSSEELARIRAACPEEGFLTACRKYQEEGEDPGLRERLQQFFEQVDRYREQASFLSVHELLWRILMESGYLVQVRALPGGVQRQANVEMLLAKAQDYEKISYHGLFHFVRYIERMQKYQMDFGEADISGRSGEAVQIMSIHHSKGLEFPVVFAAGMGKSFNKQDGREKMIFHNRWGVGLDYVDPEARMKRPTLMKQLIRRQNLIDGLGEELRVLYVAMTRAKEKLIMTGMASEKLIGTGRKGERLLFSELTGAECPLAWILPALNPEEQGSSVRVSIVSLEQVVKDAVREQMAEQLSRDELERTLLYGARDQESDEEIRNCLDWTYAWKDRTASRQKYTVTELKKLRLQDETEYGEELYPEEELVPLVPQFIEKTEEKTGAARGTIYHTVMEWMNFTRMAEQAGSEDRLQVIREELDRIQGAGKLAAEDRSSVREKDFLKFLGSDLLKRLAAAEAAGKLRREQPFVIGLPGNEADGSDPEETVLIQGMIDAFFEEDDGVVILDYKTDRVRTAGELTDRYKAQLDYYARAVSMTTGKKIKERLIYSFALGKTISL